MSDIVLDSSVAAKLVLNEPDAGDVERLLEGAARRGDSLIVLDLALVEITNAIWKHYHQRLISLAEANECFDALLHVPVRVEAASRILSPALDIALKYDRAVYDALFVALARDLGLPGVTADEPLVRAVHADFPEIVLLRGITPPRSAGCRREMP